jgi:tetratricopeptide (TPR) repeat protein
MNSFRTLEVYCIDAHRFFQILENRIMKRRIIFYIVVCSLPGLLPVCAESEPEPANPLPSAEEVSQTGTMISDERMVELNRAYGKSIELLSAGRQKDAEALIDEALAEKKDDPELWFAKGVLRRSRWVKGEAMYDFAQLLHSFPATAETRAAALSLILDQSVNPEENLRKLIALSDQHPDDVYLLWLSALQCREQKDGVAGLWQYKKLLGRFETGPVMVHHTYANVLTELLRQYDEALKHRYIALSMEQNGWTFQGLANTLVGMGRYEEACDIWVKCLAASPGKDLYWFQWGSALVSMKQYEQALAKFTNAVRLKPENNHYLRSMATCNMKLENWEEMVEQFDKSAAVQSMPTSIELAARTGKTAKETAKGVLEASDSYIVLMKSYDLFRLGNQYEQGVGVLQDYFRAGVSPGQVSGRCQSWAGVGQVSGAGVGQVSGRCRAGVSPIILVFIVSLEPKLLFEYTKIIGLTPRLCGLGAR